jgi:putative PEP-CTERM system histidine kinase
LGSAGQIVFAFAALLLLLVVLASGQTRAWLRVTIAKNFFSYRYDYRQEWLVFTDALSADYNQDSGLDENAEFEQRVILAIAKLVESQGGALWLRDEHGEYSCHNVLKVAVDATRFTETDSLPKFLLESGWIVDLDGCRGNKPEYRGLTVPDHWTTKENPYWLLVPLRTQNTLCGFVALLRANVPLRLDWEITDLLKTAGRQAASTISQKQAFAALLQARQFESFNRMSAFVVHEIKNLVAQLDLLTRNAARHQANPEFQADMLATVQNVLEHMRKLLMQLRVGVTSVDSPNLESVHQIIRATLKAKKSLQPVPVADLSIDVEPLRVRAHPERLERVIGHLLQNAAEASAEQDPIVLRTRLVDSEVLIEIEDHGQGMSEDFVRNRLFRPFESSKEMGMGIGVFESREYVREIGGKLEVHSRPGHGSVFRIRLPAVAMNVTESSYIGEA